MQSAAYIEEWDSWREGGVKVVPCYGTFEDGLFKIQEALAGGGGAVIGLPHSIPIPHFLITFSSAQLRQPRVRCVPCRVSVVYHVSTCCIPL